MCSILCRDQVKGRQPPKKKGPGVTGAWQTGHCHFGTVGEGEGDWTRCASKCKETAGIFFTLPKLLLFHAPNAVISLNIIGWEKNIVIPSLTHLYIFWIQSLSYFLQNTDLWMLLISYVNPLCCPRFCVWKHFVLSFWFTKIQYTKISSDDLFEVTNLSLWGWWERGREAENRRDRSCGSNLIGAFWCHCRQTSRSSSSILMLPSCRCCYWQCTMQTVGIDQTKSNRGCLPAYILVPSDCPVPLPSNLN